MVARRALTRRATRAARLAIALYAAVLVFGRSGEAATSVQVMAGKDFDKHLQDHRQTLVKFFAPWCGHCKKLAPDYEAAAGTLKERNVPLVRIDATEEKELASKYGVRGFPTLMWFEDGKATDYDGARTADGIVEWVVSMLGPPVVEAAQEPVPSPERPSVVLHGSSLLDQYWEAAKENRRKASWYYVKSDSGPKISLLHKGEDPVELTSDLDDKAAIVAFLVDHIMPLFGKLDSDTFDKYMATSKGVVWGLFPPEESLEELEAKYRPMMSEVGKRVHSNFFVTWTDTERFKDAVENMLSVTTFPTIAVQKNVGDKRKFLYNGEMTAQAIVTFVEDVDAGKVAPMMKSEPELPPSQSPVVAVVGSTLQSIVFTPDHDVMLLVYAPWCGHCKKLDPEYLKLAKKIRKDELTDLLTIAKIDGTSNDSPVETMDWTGFPTIFYVKENTTAPVTYEGERTAKALWKFIKKHATRAADIRERLEAKKKAKAEEL